jgi:DNA replication protein DnaC
MTMQTGPCTECGETTEREMMEGQFAEHFNRWPMVCDPCCTRRSERLAAEEAEEAARRARYEHGERLKYSGIPSTLQSVNFDDLDETGCDEAIASARYWAARGGGLLLTGPFGTGKTTIAAGALLLVLASKGGRWTSAPLMMARLGSGLDSEERRKAVALLTESRMALVLDDLDKTRPTEYGAEQIFLAIDGAVTSARPLLVTTNLGLGQLAAKWPAPFGEAIASRLAGYCKVVEVKGPDRRLGRAA